MSIQAVAWVIEQNVGSPTAKILLFCLANYADGKGECFPSQTTISKEAELSERATRDWLKSLENAKFIERRQRRRCDGTRTSDLFKLCFDRPPETPPCEPPAKSAGRQKQPADGSTPTGTTHQTYRQEVPGNEPVIEPSEEPTTSAHARGRPEFDELWNSWPEKERPQKRPVAERLFQRLATAERGSAIDYAGPYRRHQAGAGAVGLMIPYLRQLLWQEYIGGPPIDAGGYFVVTPDRAEWPAWIEAIKAGYGEWAVESSQRLGKILRRSRWPEPTTKLIAAPKDQACRSPSFARATSSDGERHHA